MSVVKIHYHRFDKNYQGLDLWTWDPSGKRNPEEQLLFPAGHDEFGPYFDLDPSQYGEEELAHQIGFLPRLHHDWSYKEGEDRYWNLDHGPEVWILSGDPTVYQDRPDVSPRIESAFLDERNRIRASLSHALSVEKIEDGAFRVQSNVGEAYPAREQTAVEVHDGRTHHAIILLDSRVNPQDKLTLFCEGYAPATVIRRRGCIDPEKCNPEELPGVFYDRDHTTFRVFSPKASRVDLVLSDIPVPTSNARHIGLRDIGDGLWEAIVHENCHGLFYGYQVDQNRLVDDIYAKCTGMPGELALIFDPKETDPHSFRRNFEPRLGFRPTDAIIYELHIRDYTIDESSGVSDFKRGKFLGLVEDGATLDGELSTAIDHISELGVTHVQLLPVHDFGHGTDSNGYNWGYMTRNFFSPEGWYASEPRGLRKIREFKQLIDAFHERDIGVILDVVFNHTAETASFEQIAKGYYYRYNQSGGYWNGSGTGNEFKSESPMGRRFIIDSCLYWTKHFGVDGFRFDLMGLIDYETLREVRREVLKVKPAALIYGEPWAATGPEGAGIEEITYKGVVSGTGVGAFNDHYRNALKGSPDGSDAGYIHNGSHRDAVIDGLKGAVHDWAHHPGDSVQYADCHDNLILWDKSAKVFPKASKEQLEKYQKLAVGILCISQGMIFLHAGVEFGRSKGGNHNSYNAPDEVNRVNWNLKLEHKSLYQYCREMIEMRRLHPIFRLATREEVEQRFQLFEVSGLPDSVIHFELNGEGLSGESWSAARIYINPTEADCLVHVSDSGWNVIVQGDNVSLSGLFHVEGTVYIPAHGILLLAKS